VSTYSRTNLAELSGVPARTIRYYQAVGLLPKPDRVGKEAVYNDDHVDRLAHIATMQRQGLRLDAIREVFDTDAYNGTAGADWSSVFNPRETRTDDALDDAQLSDILGDRRAEILGDLIAVGYVKPHNHGWSVPDYPALKGALMLYDLGTEVTVSAALWTMIRSRIATLADDVIATFTRAAGGGYAGEATRADLMQFIDRYTSTAREVGGEAFAEEIERAITEVGKD